MYIGYSLILAVLLMAAGVAASAGLIGAPTPAAPGNVVVDNAGNVVINGSGNVVLFQ
jgi:hypothetical protein